MLEEHGSSRSTYARLDLLDWLDWLDKVERVESSRVESSRAKWNLSYTKRLLIYVNV